ncbi:MAG: terpene cyclase/mutase family protein, partial [Deltaproteobacteria bacterium]|nr:terpene cyclase/mutase family protein [Deltaproteobacteria bacterium]
MARIQKRKIVDSDPVLDSIQRGLNFLASERCQDGSWRGDYGGPMFLLPMYVSACYITNQKISTARREEMILYLRNVQNSDGSIGLHSEDTGTVFTTSLAYVAMRILGVERSDPGCVKMRNWIKENGTALGAASWGKFVLALLNLYPYEGLNPILPELWLLPYAAPVHPGRLWCHCRQVYLPMAYLYRTKASVEKDDLIEELRADLYNRPYQLIDFPAHKNTVAKSDNRYPTSFLLRATHHALGFFERHFPESLRDRAVDEVYKHIKYEDEATNYIDIGPVNSVLNTIVHYFKDPNGSEFKKSFSALDQYLWKAPDGTKFNGYNSTALWDTAFAVQTILASPFSEAHKDTLKSAFNYIKNNQIIEDVPDYKSFYRHKSRGGWPFSDRKHGWPITDCTSEGFKCALQLEKILDDSIDEDLLADSVSLILSLQNLDGGWASYEKKRGGDWLEMLNPSQVFANIMVDYSYVECTSTCIQALAKAKLRFAKKFDKQIDRAIKKGVAFIKKKQKTDGSWQGSWAVCFTYGTWFGVWGLLDGGMTPDSVEIRRAAGFLIQHQNPDGGWGEDPQSCIEGRYIRSSTSRVVNTAWAVLALVLSGLADTAVVRRAVRYLHERQLENGD